MINIYLEQCFSEIDMLLDDLAGDEDFKQQTANIKHLMQAVYNDYIERQIKREERNPHVYRKTEPNVFTVGYYTPSGEWHPISDHATRMEAAEQVHFLNGEE